MVTRDYTLVAQLEQETRSRVYFHAPIFGFGVPVLSEIIKEM